MRYGSLEYKYASPIARALADNATFREWVLLQSEFSEFSDARILHDEMAVHRRKIGGFVPCQSTPLNL